MSTHTNSIKAARFMSALILLVTLAATLQAQVVGSGVFGGGRKAAVGGNAEVTLEPGISNGGGVTTPVPVINGSVYGGNDMANRVNGSTKVILHGCTIHGNVFGGGNGFYGCHNLDNCGLTYSTDFGRLVGVGLLVGDGLQVLTPVSWNTQVTVNGDHVTVDSAVYGGGHLAAVGVPGDPCTPPDDVTITSYSTTVSLTKGTIGSVFGGGRMAPVYGDIHLVFEEGNTVNVGDVFGGNDIATTEAAQDITTGNVLVKGAPTLGRVFGGSNGEYDYTNHPNEVWTFGTPAEGTEGQPDYVAAVPAKKITTLCNGMSEPILKSSSVIVQMSPVGEGDAAVTGSIAEVYGGSNAANVRETAAVTLTSGEVGVIYGGCNKSNLGYASGEGARGASVTIYGGKANTVYGGNNISGTITGGATTTIAGGEITENVFGGSNGDYGCNANGKYTGGEFANVDIPAIASTQVILNKASAVVKGNIYGGGNMAPVSSSTFVNLKAGELKGNAFAGGRMADVLGKATIVTDPNSTSALQVNNIFGGNDIAGTVNGTGGSRNYDLALDDAYSISEAGYVRIEGAPLVTNVYGGGNGDYVYNNGKVYPKGTTQEQIDADNDDRLSIATLCPTASLPNMASTFVDVKLSGGTVARTFGGGKAAEVQDALTHINGDAPSNGVATHGLIKAAFAGGDAATVTQNARLVLNAYNSSNNNADTIFGGNNQAAMYILPDLDLISGKVTNVYGGGNAGDMMASIMNVTVQDPNGVDIAVKPLASMVKVVSSAVTIENVYGGCRAAEVGDRADMDNPTGSLVYVSNGNITNVFGGNDVAGNDQYARTIIVGGNIGSDATPGAVYGGSNGKYLYELNNNIVEISSYDEDGEGNHDLVAKIPASESDPRASVGKSELYLYRGAKIIGNVYGGGLAGNGGEAYTMIDGAAIKGNIYGAGCGDYEKMNDCSVDHLGNISGTATTIVKAIVEKVGEGDQAVEYPIGTIYGGGMAGDAQNTELVLKSSITRTFPALYGGAYAGNITGTAKTTIEGSSDASIETVTTLYGGNDYGGWVHNTDLTVKAGTYTDIYGGGNGEYGYSIYGDNGKIWDENNQCKVPYSHNIVLNLENPTVKNNVYGGGNLGVSGKDYSNDEGDGVDGKVTNIPCTYLGQDLSTEYGSIVTNIYGGVYEGHVFGGARGRDVTNATYGANLDFYGETVNGTYKNRRQLAFAYKQVNMSGGYLKHSLYGGSEYIDDGYPFECIAKDNTTGRPSSVVNITGGTVEKNVYGGGYLGDIYGSVFVNVGDKAVDRSYVWVKSFGEDTYESYKPQGIGKTHLYLNASIYNASDWGEAGANSVFNTPGVYGGETQIYIDGEGYETSSSLVYQGKPFMNIKYSLMGAGTSTEGGDIRRQIIVRNYGSYTCPDVSKAFFSIQRADRVLIENSYFALKGEQDAYTAYPSPDYTFNRINELVFRDKNVVIISNPSYYIGAIRSEKALESGVSFINAGNTDYREGDLVAADDIDDNLATAGCSDADFNICSQMAAGEQRSNRLLMKEGTYVSVLPYEPQYREGTHEETGYNNNHKYGPVEGYLYLASADNTQGYVYARMKTSTIYGTDGGFMPLCEGDKTKVDGQNDIYVYTNGNESCTTAVNDATYQLHYENAHLGSETNYRVWRIGNKTGKRNRHITIVANAAVAKAGNGGEYRVPGCDNHMIGVDPSGNALENNKKYAVSYVTLQLPPSEGGNYYKINNIVIDQDNDQVKFIETAYNKYLGYRDREEGADWLRLYDDDDDQNSTDADAELTKLSKNPNYTFGLMFNVGTNFTKEEDLSEGETLDGNQNAVLVGAANYSETYGFKTTPVNIDNASGVIPEMQFALTFDPSFSNTIIRDAVFYMMEYDARGNEVGEVEVTVTIATVIQDFVDMEIPLLAMYNEGRRDTYTKKIIIPASFERRNLRLTSLEWIYDNSTEGAQGDDQFYLVSSDKENKASNEFGISIKVTENVSDNVANTLGWYNIATENFDIYKQVYSNGLGKSRSYNCPSGYVLPNDPITSFSTTPESLPYNSDNDDFIQLASPIPIGDLDGRATAAMDVTLHFNGMEVYGNDPWLGYVFLNMVYNGKDGEPHDFRVRLRVWSREQGDTIYLASRNQFTRTGKPTVVPDDYENRGWSRDANDNTKYTITLNRGIYGGSTSDEGNSSDQEDDTYGKRPSRYVTTFKEAMEDIYQPGDVLCILDTLIIKGESNITLNGTDYSEIEIIRYSGSHPDAPGTDFAYVGPMIKVQEDAKFKAINCEFNGSGITREFARKEDDRGTHFADYNCKPLTSLRHDGSYNLIDHLGRYPAIVYSQAPVFVVEQAGRLELGRNVVVKNNFNDASYSVGDKLGSAEAESHYPGGAIGVYRSQPLIVSNSNTSKGIGSIVASKSDPELKPKDYSGAIPIVILGDNINIYDNCVFNSSLDLTKELAHFDCVGPRGAGIFNSDAEVQVGSSGSNDLITITNNYLVKDKDVFIKTGEKVMLWHPSKPFCYKKFTDYWFLDVDKEEEMFTKYKQRGAPSVKVPVLKGSVLSNVLLTRTESSAGSPNPDAVSSVVTFNQKLNKNTRIGISKWFPDLTTRDTIKFAMNTSTYVPNSDSAYVFENFFDDRNQSYVFYHHTISPKLIYFQRCATFKQRNAAGFDNIMQYAQNEAHFSTEEGIYKNQNSPTSYAINWDSKCSAVLDTLTYRLQGGFYPYSYTWQCATVDEYKGTNYLYTERDGDPESFWDPSSNTSVRTVRDAQSTYENTISVGTAYRDERIDASQDKCVTVDLRMIPTNEQLDMVYRVVGNDLTGNCPMPQEIDIRVMRSNEGYNTGDISDEFIDDKVNIKNPGFAENLKARIGDPGSVGGSPRADTTRIRYIRLCKGVHLTPDVQPSWEYGDICFTASYQSLPNYDPDNDNFQLEGGDVEHFKVNDGRNAFDVSKKYFCPGDVLTLSTNKKPGKESASFLMWDFDPQAPQTDVLFTMPEHDYEITAIYRPNTLHWYEVVTSNPGTDDYEVDYDGNVTIKSKYGLAWLISTTNGLNGQQAREFHNKTITINGDFDMSEYLWTPLGTMNNPFAGHFNGGGHTISGIICLEDSLTYVGVFGNVGCTTSSIDPGVNSTTIIENTTFKDVTLKGNNYVGGIAAMAKKDTEIKNNKILDLTAISGSYIVGGVVAKATDGVSITGNEVKTQLIGNAINAGGIVAIAENDVSNTNSITLVDYHEFLGTSKYKVGTGDLTPVPSEVKEVDATEEEKIVVFVKTDDNQATITAEYRIVVEKGKKGYIQKVIGPNDNTIGGSIRIESEESVSGIIANNSVDVSTVKLSTNREGAIVEEVVANSKNKNVGFFGRLFGKNRDNNSSLLIANNYVRFTTNGNAFVSGGLMGQAYDATILNNYVYGRVNSENNAGALVGYVGNNVTLDRCYYKNGTSENGAIGGGKKAKTRAGITSFAGSGNRVYMDDKVGGVNNLTRVLNQWALAQNLNEDNDYLSWRSDLERENNGLPLFGDPDIISVYDSVVSQVCDQFVWLGDTLSNSAVFSLHVVDSSRYLDSTLFFIYHVHHSERTSVFDSVAPGEGYEGYGFSYTAEELAEMVRNIPSFESDETHNPLVHLEHGLFRTLELVDSLLTENGCDSIVVLSLTLYTKVDIDDVEEPINPAEVAFDINVYPNPTRSLVNVETEDIVEVEIFDAVSRKVAHLKDLHGDHAVVDLAPYSSGIYYLRVRTTHGVAIKKVIKK